jgi:hypothetical protein
MKSSVDEIRQRFDADVERFSNLETGQSATVDAPLAMALVAQAAAVTTPHARHVLDVGCGAGNYALKLLERLPNLDATLIDLSQPMLDRARERVSRATHRTHHDRPGRHPGGQTPGRGVRHCTGRCGPSTPTHRRGVAGRVHGLSPGAAAWRLGVGVRLVESSICFASVESGKSLRSG